MHSRAFARSIYGPVAMAIAFVIGLAIAPAPAHSQERKTSSAKATSSYESKSRLGVPSSDIQRGNAYARVVWMPEIATSSIAGSPISFGIARLNPAVRRGLGIEGSGLAAAAPVVSLQMSRNTSLTFIKLLGDNDGAMIALQLKLGS